MNRVIVVLILGFFHLTGYSQNHFIVKVNTTKLFGKMIYLNIFNNNDFIPVHRDSCKITDGDIRLVGYLDQPSQFARFFIKDKGKYISADFVIDSGENNINLELIEGTSKSLKLHSDTKGNHIFDELQGIFNSNAENTKVNGYYQISSGLLKQILDEQRKRLEEHSNDFGSLLYLYRLGRSDYTPDFAKDLLTTFDTFSDSMKKSVLGKKLYEEKTNLINNIKSARIGSQVLEFSVANINNQLFKSADLTGQNYLIVFSATWCGPCQKQLPRLKEIYEKYKSKGFKVVYFNNDDDVIRWKKHVVLNKLDWINVSERLKPSVSKIQRSFGVYAIPTCLLINKNGVIVYNSDQMDTELQQLEAYVKKTID